MKKIFALGIIFVFLLSICSCSSINKNDLCGSYSLTTYKTSNSQSTVNGGSTTDSENFLDDYEYYNIELNNSNEVIITYKLKNSSEQNNQVTYTLEGNEVHFSINGFRGTTFEYKKNDSSTTLEYKYKKETTSGWTTTRESVTIIWTKN